MIQQRNIAVCIILSIVTCGIYGIYWFIVLSKQYPMRRMPHPEELLLF